MGKLKTAVANEMVERVAAAILDAEGVHWDDTKDWEKNQYRTMARAAIKAMREPTEEMKKAIGVYYGHDIANWQRMIDAAFAKAEG